MAGVEERATEPVATVTEAQYDEMRAREAEVIAPAARAAMPKQGGWKWVSRLVGGSDL